MNQPLLTTQITVHVNGQASRVPLGCSVAAALAHAGQNGTRRSLTGQPRSAFCGMGQCQECRVSIDGMANRLACLTPVKDGMKIETET
ncbi:(2Fe-2S)-binding protein [Roseateles oligotrophus]|uniref:(2Fe-2S)-binding protein n=1 Tax=Roseateles oligotrophus TaxID=1769250 RepID=A0ABT2YHH3_9BURK|nr:(2Fe-2S)-binding protein [Roseateles oligotrophus]MCV2369506.1 (2Fe-2S)-binding protein [Roseateles oligotrophus]